MTIWYISTTGSDTTGDGSSGNPYLTVSKCLTVGIDGDTVRALSGTYTITSTTNIDKQFTITSNSGVATDVIFDANTTIFNIQNSNVSITYVTLQTSNALPLVTIDRMSTGSTVPTFWTGINISNCNVKYVTNALSLNGTFTINNNTFTRSTGTNVADLIKVYSTRGACSINSNTFTDSQPVQYVIYLTSTGSGTYLDRCNSKGGTLTIASNNVTFTNFAQVTNFIYQDYFHQFTYVTSPDEQYNTNTKLSLIINNNIISSSNYCYLFYITTLSNSSYNTFGVCRINTNTVNNTNYGALHLGKNINSTSLTIDSNDLTRSVFKIYSNVLDTTKKPYIYMPYSNTVLYYESNQTIGVSLTYGTGTPVLFIDSSVNALRDGKSTLKIGDGTNKALFFRYSNTNLFKINANTEFTIQSYMKILSPPAWCLFTLNSFSNGIMFRPTGSADSLYINNGAIDIRSYFTANQWHHISIVRNLTTQTVDLYVDGVYKTQFSILNSASINSAGGNLWIGSNALNGSEPFHGYVSDFVFINGQSIINKIYE
jgi:hypothetical protein